jgi:hypothetical protein
MNKKPKKQKKKNPKLNIKILKSKTIEDVFVEDDFKKNKAEEGKMIERLELIKAMEEKKPKDFVRMKFNEYFAKYDDMDKTVLDKVDYRDVLYDYNKYMKD